MTTRPVYEESPGEFVFRIRTRVLKMTQVELVELIAGAGANSISRYELGKVPVPRALMVLLGLLEQHPHLIDDIKARHNTLPDSIALKRRSTSKV